MAATDYLLVAAFDFGTTYSGYAFQLTSDYNPTDPTLKILCPQAWNRGPTKLASLKTPTCLLLDRNQDIDCFGYMAEEKYAELCMEKDHTNWYFFRRFKMHLFDNKTLNVHFELSDESGKKMPAIKVFSLSIKCLKDHLFDLLSKRNISVGSHEISWVLTVPAIWDDTAKQFMRQAAEMAGIPSEHLCIALEPEAASIFCQYLPVEKFSVGGTVKFADAKPGTTYMIVDLGGGTADITVHEKLSKGKLKEVYRASGGPWGGAAVDSSFIEFLSSILGGPVMSEFMKEQKYDYLELMREFESVKRNINLSGTDAIKMKFPVSLNETCTKVRHKDMKTLVEESRKNKQITFIGDKAKIDADLMRALFRKVTDKIVNHMKNILENKPEGKNISLILMVGGFSESLFIQDVIKNEFHEKNGRYVLIPRDAGITVVQGAVIYGRQPDNISSRILRFTYGVSTDPEFDDVMHDPKKKHTVNGIDRCKDVFSQFMKIGKNVPHGFKQKESYTTLYTFQDSCKVDVYVSTDPYPSYVDDESCRKLGSLTVKIPNPTKDTQNISVEYIFGDTELHVKAMDETSGTPCTTVMKMLE